MNDLVLPNQIELRMMPDPDQTKPDQLRLLPDFEQDPDLAMTEPKVKLQKCDKILYLLDPEDPPT